MCHIKSQNHSDPCVGFWRSLTSECCCTKIQCWIRVAAAEGKTPVCHAELIPIQSQAYSLTGQQHGAVFRDQAVPAVRHPQEPTGGWLCGVLRATLVCPIPTVCLCLHHHHCRRLSSSWSCSWPAPGSCGSWTSTRSSYGPTKSCNVSACPQQQGAPMCQQQVPSNRGSLANHPGVAPDLPRRSICLPLDAHDMPAAVPQCCPGRAW